MSRMAEGSPPRFRWHDLPNTSFTGARCYSITVPERDLDYSSALPALATLWSACPKWLKEVERVPLSLQSYTLTWHQSAGDARIFFFSPPDTEGQQSTAFKSETNVEQGIYWPPVLVDLFALQDPDGNYTFKPYYKEASGACEVTVEEFFSATKFNISITEEMMPLPYDDVVRVGGLTFDYSFGRCQLKQCLRGARLLNLVTPTVEVNGISYPFSYLYIGETNYSDWPATRVLEDRQQQVLGGYLRRRVTAASPITTVTSPY